MKKKKSSKFKNWFEAQFGKPPFPPAVTFDMLISRRDYLHRHILEAENNIKLFLDYEKRFDAALKSWIASDGR